MSNTSAINSELFANLVGAAQFAAYENSVARQLTTVFDLPSNAGKTVQVPVWSSIAAETITDESAATAKATNTTSASITMKEHVVFHRITDMLRDSSYSDVISQVGDQSGRAIAEAMDTQAFAEFANLTGAGGSAIAVASFTVNNIMDRVAAIRAAKVVGPFFAVIHPLAANALKKALTATTSYQAASGVANSILQNYFVGQIAGCTIIESALVPYNSSTGVATCGVFAPSALGHAMRGTISMEEQRQAAARATDVVLTGVAGAAVLQAAHGYALEIDLVA
jgi:N4-gp56 family major capsid protein